MKPLFVLLFALCCIPSAEAGQIRVVDLADDTDTANGTCNLREAITAANTDTAVDACAAGNGTDDIVFDVTGTLALSSGLPSIESSVNLYGPGADLLEINAGAAGSRVLMFISPPTGDVTSTLSGLTLTEGTGQTGGGLLIMAQVDLTVSDAVITANETSFAGGGIILSGGILTLIRTTVDSNIEGGGGGGGGVKCDTGGTLTLRYSTISNNTGSSGGGVFALGCNLTIETSTISGNTARNNGGGVNFFSLDDSHTLSILNSTITNNTILDAPVNNSNGGGLYISGGQTIGLTNTIIAENIDNDTNPQVNPDIWVVSDPLTILTSFNLIGDNSGADTVFPAGNPNANNDYVGIPAAPLDPGLGPLRDYGGPTLSHLPLAAATNVVDKGSCDFALYDQRGQAGSPLQRPYDHPDFPGTGAGCDIGAVERQAPLPTLDFRLFVLLDGPYAGPLMNTDLEPFIPLAQPYNTSPWNYAGPETFTSIPSTMVDWVLISLRTGIPSASTEVYRQAFGLSRDGTLIKPAGYDPPTLDIGPYYIVVEHRNHLSVMSALPYTPAWYLDGLSYVFNTAQDRAYTQGSFALRDRGDGKFTIWGGDGDANGNVTAFDFLNTWLPINGGPAGYQAGDFNMDGSGTAFDFLTVWLPANGLASQVP